MNFFKKLLVFFLLIAMIIPTFSSCKKRDGFLGIFGNVIKQFGEFDSYGETLKQYAIEEISADEAKALLIANAAENSQNLGTAIPGVREGDLPLPSDELVNYFMSNYSDCTATTTYYIKKGKKGKEVDKEDFLQGTDFKAMISENTFIPFNQLVAKMIVAFPELIDYMEAQNRTFEMSDTYDVAPFKTCFSYHKDKDGNLVIQCRDFSEIPSSESGGVACSYRQDTEIVFDSFNKISNWQTSLGVYTASPQSTIKQGYILKVDFNWHKKH